MVIPTKSEAFIAWLNDGEEYISRSRLAQMLDIKEDSLMQNISRGRWKFKPLRSGTVVLFSRSQILAELGSDG